MYEHGDKTERDSLSAVGLWFNGVKSEITWQSVCNNMAKVANLLLSTDREIRIKQKLTLTTYNHSPAKTS